MDAPRNLNEIIGRTERVRAEFVWQLARELPLCPGTFVALCSRTVPQGTVSRVWLGQPSSHLSCCTRVAIMDSAQPRRRASSWVAHPKDITRRPGRRPRAARRQRSYSGNSRRRTARRRDGGGSPGPGPERGISVAPGQGGRRRGKMCSANLQSRGPERTNYYGAGWRNNLTNW